MTCPPRKKRTRAKVAAWGAALTAMLTCGSASAFDGEITSDSAAQFYDVVSPTGQVTLTRRRLTTTLGLDAYNLLESPMGDPKAPELSLRARVRYDADYGAPPAETDTNQPNSLVPGFTPESVDIMYAYLEGRRFFGGWFGFKLGAQYITDVLGWWGLDGLEMAVTTPYYVKAEVYGGVEQRGGLLGASSRFEGDGVWRGSRADYGPLLYPAYQPENYGPAVGVALESTGVSWLHARLTYRRVYDTGTSNTAQFFYGIPPEQTTASGARISSEKIGYAVEANLPSVGGIKGGIVYDFYRSEVTSAYASVDVYAGKQVTIAADYDYYQPSFDGDSIWNFFDSQPRSDVGLRATFDATKELAFSADAHVHVFGVDTTQFEPQSEPIYLGTGIFPTNSHSLDEGGSFLARWRTGETHVAANARGDFGSEGDRVGADLSGEHVFETRYIVGGRIGLWQWKDSLQPDRETTSFQYVASLGYRFLPRCRGTVEFEDDINGLVGQRLRLMLLLNLAVSK
jgi:hypothetical protein